MVCYKIQFEMKKVLAVISISVTVLVAAMNSPVGAQTTMYSSMHEGQTLFVDDYRPGKMYLNKQVTMRVYYNTVSVVDTVKDKKVIEMAVLEIAPRMTKYISYNNFLIDSLYAVSNDSPANLVLYHVVLKNKEYYPQTFYESYFMDYAKGVLTFTGRLGNTDFIYEEDIPAIEWKIEDSTDVIGSHTVQKAVCSFRGRNYTVWFTPDIPVPYGPWKFSGLPGLILSVYDDTGSYRIDVQRFTSDCGDDRIWLPKYKFIKTTRKKYLENRENMVANYSMYFNNFSNYGIRMGVPEGGYVRKELGNGFMELDYK